MSVDLKSAGPHRPYWLLAGLAIVLAVLSCNLGSTPETREQMRQPTTDVTDTLQPTATPEPVLALESIAGEKRLRQFVARLRTTSGWTRVLFEGAAVASSEHEVLTGADMPDLDIRRLPELRITHSGGSGQATEVEYSVHFGELDEDSIRIGIGKGHNGRTDLELLAVNGGERSSVRDMTHVGVASSSDPLNRRWFEIDASVLSAAPPVEVEGRALEKLLLAFYYPWYGSRQGPTGFDRAWEDKPPPNTPRLGMYDSQNPEVFRQHIEWARRAGIDGFIVSWWGQGDFTDEVLREVVLPIAAEESFPITLYYEPLGTPDQIAANMRYILTTYGQHPAYMQVDGAPVIFAFHQVTVGNGRAEWEYVFDQLEHADLECFCQAAGLLAAFHRGDTGFDYLFELFEGVHMYAFGALPLDLVARLNRSNALKATVLGTSYAATVNPGVDNSLWHDDFGFDRLVIERMGGEYYRRTWQAATASDPDWILLTSFNEWHEGTEIEPSEEHGETYIDMTRELVDDWK